MANWIVEERPEAGIDDVLLQACVAGVVDRIADKARRILILPPDMTRLNSGAGRITALLYDALADGAHVDVMPALGTHLPMTEAELRHMFGERIPLDRFKVHDWRNRLRYLGEVPGARLAALSDNRVDYPVRIEVDDLLFDGYDLILSVGQVVPHEVVGMANYTKNVCVGAGGPDIINKSHFLGAVCGMERIMGRIDTPVRRLYNEAVEQYLADLPIVYLLTVVATDAAGDIAMKGFYAGDDRETFERAARLSQQQNITLVDAPLEKVVVYLDPAEFKSTWLGNKAVYRTRMAMADDGELIILAPGLRTFGEDPTVDALIRTYGYRGTPRTLAAVKNDPALQENLGAAAHLIHGSSEGRFRVTYCPGPGLSEAAMQGVGYRTADLDSMLQRYRPDRLVPGPNTLPDGETIFYVPNPALGLWAEALT